MGRRVKLEQSKITVCRQRMAEESGADAMAPGDIPELVHQ